MPKIAERAEMPLAGAARTSNEIRHGCQFEYDEEGQGGDHHERMSVAAGAHSGQRDRRNEKKKRSEGEAPCDREF